MSLRSSTARLAKHFPTAILKVTCFYALLGQFVPVIADERLHCDRERFDERLLVSYKEKNRCDEGLNSAKSRKKNVPKILDHFLKDITAGKIRKRLALTQDIEVDQLVNGVKKMKALIASWDYSKPPSVAKKSELRLTESEILTSLGASNWQDFHERFSKKFSLNHVDSLKSSATDAPSEGELIDREAFRLKSFAMLLETLKRDSAYDEQTCKSKNDEHIAVVKDHKAVCAMEKAMIAAKMKTKEPETIAKQFDRPGNRAKPNSARPEATSESVPASAGSAN